MDQPVVGAFNFKDWWITVWVRSGEVAVPEVCACCLGAADASARVECERGEARPTFTHPICSTCARHAQVDDWLVGLSLACGVLLPLLGWYAAFGTAVLRRLHIMLLFWVVSGLLVTVAVYYFIALFVAGKTPTCPDSGAPVDPETNADPISDLMGTDTERTDEKEARLLSGALAQKAGAAGFGLRFRNLDYARRFLEANGAGGLAVPRVDAKI